MLTPSHGSLEKMAVQVTCDFALGVNFKTSSGDQQMFQGSALGNNINPSTVVPGAACHDRVSFHGAGVLSTGVWVSADSFNADGSRKMRTDHNATTGELTQVWEVKIVAAGTSCLVGRTSESAPMHRFFLGRRGRSTASVLLLDTKGMYPAAPRWPENPIRFSRFQDAVNA